MARRKTIVGAGWAGQMPALESRAMEPNAEMLLCTIERAGYPVTVASTADDATGTTTYTATAVDDAGGRRFVTAPSGLQALFELADQIGFEKLHRQYPNRLPTPCAGRPCAPRARRIPALYNDRTRLGGGAGHGYLGNVSL